MSVPQPNTAVLEQAIEAVVALRRDGAIVHCVTNTVAQNFTANVLLACGATPSMTVSPQEVPYFSQRADGVLINLGTLDEPRKEAMRLSAKQCSATRKPLVIDPVMCHVSPPRLEFAKELLANNPHIVRANADETNALLDAGVSLDNIVHVKTGAIDSVQYDGDSKTISNGHPWLSRVTAVGCAQGALMAALISKVDDGQKANSVAAIAALVWMGVSGEIAAANATGPGSFQTALLDVLHSVSPKTLKQFARIT